MVIPSLPFSFYFLALILRIRTYTNNRLTSPLGSMAGSSGTKAAPVTSVLDVDVQTRDENVSSLLGEKTCLQISFSDSVHWRGRL